MPQTSTKIEHDPQPVSDATLVLNVLHEILPKGARKQLRKRLTRQRSADIATINRTGEAVKPPFPGASPAVRAEWTNIFYRTTILHLNLRNVCCPRRAAIHWRFWLDHLLPCHAEEIKRLVFWLPDGRFLKVEMEDGVDIKYTHNPGQQDVDDAKRETVAAWFEALNACEGGNTLWFLEMIGEVAFRLMPGLHEGDVELGLRHVHFWKKCPKRGPEGCGRSEYGWGY